MSPLSERKQHLNRKLNWTSLSLDTWFWEWLSIAFSVLCFIATVGLLLAYHNSPSPNLPHGLTLNTIVSVLATASKASLLLTIGTSIGQLKWIWFQQDSKRQLYNLQSFDDASRGPLGSLKILFQRPQQGRLLLSLAAVVTLLALAFDPFMQQIVSYPVREVPSLTAKATTKQAMLPFEPPTFGADDNDFFNAMNAGLWSGNFPTPGHLGRQSGNGRSPARQRRPAWELPRRGYPNCSPRSRRAALTRGYRLASQVLLSQDETTRGGPNPAPHQQSDSMRDLPMRQNTHSITVSGGKLSINNDTINYGRIFNHNYTIDPPLHLLPR